MKSIVLFLAMVFGFQLASIAQANKSDKNSPKKDIRVKREYDDKGNLIKFDSVYSYSYSWSSDTTLLKSMSPDKFPDHFGFFPDSTFMGNSFFDDFDQSFFAPFADKKDSILNMHGFNHHFKNFKFKNDTIDADFSGFDEFFRQFNDSTRDSISSKLPGHAPFSSNPKSMDEMMKMLKQQMEDMKEFQRNFFKEPQDLKKF